MPAGTTDSRDDVEPTPRVVCILGMHRSGTSSLAGSLEEAGLDLGEVQTQNPYNPKGNRESLVVMHLHDDVLAACGGSWHQPPPLVRWEEVHARRRDAIIDSHAAAEMWGFKDPRTLLTVDGWLEALPHMEFAATFRHPMAVVESLQRRGGGSTSQWLELWVYYNRKLLALLERFDIPLVEFGRRPDAYRDALIMMANKLELAPPADGMAFFEPGLHNFAPDDQQLPTHVQTLYQALRAATI